MDLLESLKMDDVKLTGVGEEYLNKNQIQFKKYNETYKNTEIKHVSSDKINENCRKLKQLVTQINEHSNTFTELEYIMRKVNMDDVKNYDLKLLTNNLLDISSTRKKKCWNSNRIIMKKDTPLTALGCVAQVLMTYDCVIIESTEYTAFICHLFVNLCHKVGLDKVLLVLLENDTDFTPHQIDITKIECYKSGCLGVVTEQCDVDAAVDAFLASPNANCAFPWKLRRVFIQESIYNKFKNILSWKAKLKNIPANEEQLPASLRKLCSNTYMVGDKIFLVDYTGPPIDSDDKYIFLEAYRTTKELLGMAKTYFFCISLWSSDISEANEIAFNINSSLTWINDYGHFAGSPRTADAFYGAIHQQQSFKLYEPNERVFKLKKIRESWLKLDIKKRRDMIFNALEVYIQANDSKVDYAYKIQDAVMKFEDRFVDIENGTIYICTKDAVGFVVVSDHDIVDAIASIVIGNAFIVESSEHKDLLKVLEDQGLPVQVHDRQAATFDAMRFSTIDVLHHTRAVCTSFGTTFAN